MREILFRGIATDGLLKGKWVFGFYVIGFWHGNGSEYGIMPTLDKELGGYYEVIPETVGQYTGLKDKNGKRIFEGDILDCKSGLYERCKVIYNEFCSAFQLECADGFSDFFLCSINHKEMEVIGNIHDNPELLKGN